MAGAAALLAALALTGDAGAEVSPELDRLLAGGLAYLASTGDELGVDVVVLLEVLADLTGDERARRVAELRRRGLAPAKVEPFEALFGIAKPVLDGRRDRKGPRPAVGGREADRAPAAPRMSDCLVAAARCSIAPDCEQVALDRNASGRELTHQAVWLLFVRWLDCATEADLEALRANLVARLRSEIDADSSYSETSLERLAVLGQLGHADQISPLWWPTLVGAQGGPGCWGVARGGPCHPHPTILALWALTHLDASRSTVSSTGR